MSYGPREGEAYEGRTWARSMKARVIDGGKLKHNVIGHKGSSWELFLLILSDCPKEVSAIQ